MNRTAQSATTGDTSCAPLTSICDPRGNYGLELIVVLISVLVLVVSAGTTAVVLGDDRSAHGLDLLVLLLDLLGLGIGVGGGPFLAVLEGIVDLLLLLVVQLLRQTLVVTRTLDGHLH